MTDQMSITEYVNWVNQATPGDRLTYHVGHLAHDRGRFGPKMEWLPEPLDALANLIYQDAELGLVELTQCPNPREPKKGWREGQDRIRPYEYYATRTTKEL